MSPLVRMGKALVGGQLCEWLAVLVEVLSCPVIHARAKWVCCPLLEAIIDYDTHLHVDIATKPTYDTYEVA